MEKDHCKPLPRNPSGEKLQGVLGLMQLQQRRSSLRNTEANVKAYHSKTSVPAHEGSQLTQLSHLEQSKLNVCNYNGNYRSSAGRIRNLNMDSKKALVSTDQESSIKDQSPDCLLASRATPKQGYKQSGGFYKEGANFSSDKKQNLSSQSTHHNFKANQVRKMRSDLSASLKQHSENRSN